MKSHSHAGQFNLRGKKSRVLSCKCCVVKDFRYKYALAQADKMLRKIIKEMRE